MDAPPLQVQLLGTFRLRDGAAPVQTVHAPRLQALLAYLIVHRDTPQPRRQIAFALWPGSTEAQALTNLRNLVHQLRRLLPRAEACLALDGPALQWRPDAPASLDVAAFEEALAEAEARARRGQQAEAGAALAAAIATYGGDLLPDCYDEWALPERERLRQRLVAALGQLIELHEAQRDYGAALPYAQRLVQIEPLHEMAYLQLLRLHALCGDRAAALQTYQACAATLERELGVAPGEQLCAAHERLRCDYGQGAPPAECAPLAPLVGRRAEWQLALRAWRGELPGRPRLLVLSGEAGIGKTRLAEELLRWVGRQGFAAARAPCYAGEEDLLYAPVVAWLRAPPIAAARAGLAPVWLAELARLLPELREERPDLPPELAAGEPWQRQRLFDAVRRAILSAGLPLLLLLDDMQWCDHASLDWLRYLLHDDAARQLLVVGTLRPDEVAQGGPLAELLGALYARGQAAAVELAPLTAAETAELAAQVMGRGLDAGEGAALYADTEGNPLFVIETLRATDGRGACLLVAGERGGAPGAAAPPARVHAVIARRLARLSPLARGVADSAAVIGRDFSLPILARVCADLDEEALLSALDELRERRIIRDHADASYDFSHPKLREVAYLELGGARRRRAHRRVAEALAAIEAEHGDLFVVQQALHYEQAGCGRAAAFAYGRAAAAARRVFAAGHAVAHYRRALGLLASDGATAAEPRPTALEGSLHEGLGEALALAADHEAARLALGAALELAGDAVTRARLARLIGNTWRAQARFDQAEWCYGRARAALGEAGPEQGHAYWHEAVALHHDQVTLVLRSGRGVEAAGGEGPSELALEQHATPAQRARAAHLGLIAAWWRERCRADEALLARAEQVVALADTAGDPHLRALIHCQLSLLPLTCGDVGRAEALVRSAQADAERLDDETLLAHCLVPAGLILRRRGAVEAARANGLRCLALSERYGLADGLGAAHAGLSWVAWRTGDLPGAEAHGRAALGHWRATPIAYPFQWAALLPLLAVALAGEGATAAVEHARALVHPCQQLLPAPLEAALAAGIGACERAGGEAALAHLRRALAAAEERGLL